MINAMQTVRRRRPRLIAFALAIFGHALFFTLGGVDEVDSQIN
ncbi:MAG TPA: hypothetical protein VFE10_09395 [Phenylobacterium sp.]|jgi:hypothetical protein|nr:hypothetical protein [Phenylobacterium sp.]